MNRIIKIILHLFYWMVFCLFTGIIGYRLSGGFEFISQNIFSFLYNLAWAAVQFYAFYFFFYLFIEKQRYTAYFVLSLFVSVGVSFILTILYKFLFNIHINYRLIEFVPQMFGTFIIGQTGSLLRGFIHWFEDIQRKQEMEKIVLQNELDTLNAQLNPHFLFNTLNNIDSLIHSNSEKASESLVTLSEIMRYMLYDARKPNVPLMNEVNHYKNIIKLQSLRFKNPELVSFDVEIQNETVEIAPLLFLPFIENTFKYATFEEVGATIEMSLKSDGKNVKFNCRNHFRKNDPSMNTKTGGIGLSNLKRRLELLYKGRYALKINDENSFFIAQLTIEP
jgi:two-component system LytT family sensor kinase